MDEFALIKKYCSRDYPDVTLGVGDDAAIVDIALDHQLVVSTDAFIEGRHFFANTDPHAIGYKSLAVNLSDMAAMGAQPKWATVCLTLPKAESAWLDRFYQGFFIVAEQYNVRIIGGDTNQGPLNIAIQILGEVPTGLAITRRGARVGEDVWVSGELGLAAMAVAERYGKMHLSGEDSSACAQRLDYPTARVALGLALRGIASAMLDISDGLLADVGHIAEVSRVGIEIQAASLINSLSQVYAERLEKQLTGGDDYELCFTAPIQHRPKIFDIGHELGLSVHRIGHTSAASGKVHCVLPDGKHWQPNTLGFQHF